MNRLFPEYALSRLSRVLCVSRSRFYRTAGLGPRAQSDRELLEHIHRIYRQHKKRYGSPRIHLQLENEGLVCGENRVARLMREAGLQAVYPRRKRPRTTNSHHQGPIAPNLLKGLTIKAPNQAWAMDITYVHCGISWVYLAAVLDLFLHKIVGWELSEKIDAHLVQAALRHAARRQGYPEEVLTHSDRGCQYASEGFIGLVDALGYQRSMSAKGNCYDNAAMESFFGVLKREELDRWEMPTLEAVRNRVFDYIETYYNRERIHTAIGMTPAEFEKGFFQETPSAEFLKACVAPSVGQKKAGASRPRPRPMVATSEYPSESCSPAELSSVSSDEQDIQETEIEIKHEKR
ncbi:MAG: IS3 family transposase [Lentisphaerota bacterium]